MPGEDSTWKPDLIIESHTNPPLFTPSLLAALNGLEKRIAQLAEAEGEDPPVFVDPDVI